MAEYIVLRLVPEEALPADQFTNALQDLTVKVYDISTANPAPTVELGSAIFIAPQLTPFGSIFELRPSGNYIDYDDDTRIVQDVVVEPLLNPLYAEITFKSAATVLVELTHPGAGSIKDNGANIQIEFNWVAKSVKVHTVFWEVRVHPGPLPDPDQYVGISVADDAAYVTLPMAESPGASILPADGSPPTFEALKDAVESVITNDPHIAGPSDADVITALSKSGQISPERCKVVAYDIVWRAQPPLPGQPEPLDDMFTNPPNLGSSTDDHEMDRKHFLGDLSSYYGIRNATAERLKSYVFAYVASLDAQAKAKKEQRAIIKFPIDPVQANLLAPIKDAEIIINLFDKVNNVFAVPPFDIPAQYFYALGAKLPDQVSSEQRYEMAYRSKPQDTFAAIIQAIQKGVIDEQGVNAAQAIRMLAALNVPATSTIVECDLSGNAGIKAIFDNAANHWRRFPIASDDYLAGGDDAELFWKPLAGSADAGNFLDLVLFVLTENAAAGQLATHIRQNFPSGAIDTVQDLAATSPGEWKTFFENNVALLPKFTEPGTDEARIQAFIRRVQQFFDLEATLYADLVPKSSPAPTITIPTSDPISECLAAIGGVFVFGQPTPNNLSAAAATVFPTDPQAAAWLVQCITTINELAICTNTGDPALQMSMMEGLFARGFTSTSDIIELSFEEFQQALIGTVAYDSASTIFQNANGGNQPSPGGTSEFAPINDGSLVNCIPPCYASPLSPTAYLQELLKLTSRSTCDKPFSDGEDEKRGTLATVIRERRGPVGDLHVTCANLETPVPLIDLVNECLESAVSGQIAGTIHDTPETELADHRLCQGECCECNEDCPACECEKQDSNCHEPAAILRALPSFSTPAILEKDDIDRFNRVYSQLESSFASCCLPYSQPLDVSRTYLRYLRTCRFELMRTFHRCITEWVLDPVSEPADFQTHLWRYPVRIDIAIEYLGISPDEYLALFGGAWPVACVEKPDGKSRIAQAPPSTATLFGFTEQEEGWTTIVRKVPEFLKAACLTYCEFIELWKSGFVRFKNAVDREGNFPDCEPCCLDDLIITFVDEVPAEGELFKLAIFIRLWRKLHHLCGAEYSFAELSEICKVLRLFEDDKCNPDFIRQLAALQMLRDQFGLQKHHKAGENTSYSDRTLFLALWEGSSPNGGRATTELLRGIERFAKCHHKCEARLPKFIKILEDNLVPLSRLAGFDSDSPSDTWDRVPTHTLRFAEILAKIYASPFTVGEILFLFTTSNDLQGDDPFCHQGENECLDDPLELPDDLEDHDLWSLRRKLLEACQLEEASEDAHWREVSSVLVSEFGFAETVVLELGQHFFPNRVISSGTATPSNLQQFVTTLPAGQTSAPKWSGECFTYENDELRTSLPVNDHDVLMCLARVGSLNAQERAAVQDLYYRPRAMLAPFALLFEDFREAESQLIQEGDEARRWQFFVQQVQLSRHRCEVIADHLAQHVCAVAQELDESQGRHCKHEHSLDLKASVLLILKKLRGDENKAVDDWEADDGTIPGSTWGPHPSGGALAALLGLVGTGLQLEYSVPGGSTLWRDFSCGAAGFGLEANERNCPLPTVLPELAFNTNPRPKLFDISNGLGFREFDSSLIGGIQGHHVRFTGALLIDCAGCYEFLASSPCDDRARWQVTLKRGQRTWTVLEHSGEGRGRDAIAKLDLKVGAYDLLIDFQRPNPEFDDEDDVNSQSTGFVLSYRKPGDDEFQEIPHRNLFLVEKNGHLSDGIEGLENSAKIYLSNRYTSSLRDIRRTYQRAFKAVLFSYRFELSGKDCVEGQSELGYMLSQTDCRFAGASYFRSGAGSRRHLADFNFNLFPVSDNYHVPSRAVDSRVDPSLKRMQALFDWWERMFDYGQARAEVRCDCGRRLWHLFVEANSKQPADARTLLKHICADGDHQSIDLRYFREMSVDVATLGWLDLADDRWAIRAWHSDRWLNRLEHNFRPFDMSAARPDLWSSFEPASNVGSEQESGNTNLSAFVCNGLLENGQPRQYGDLKDLNDGLRERGRCALIDYLCGPAGFAKDSKGLTDKFLIDVDAGICEAASRIDQAISSVQTFIMRARLGLEPGWKVAKEFAEMWDSMFASYNVWQACKRKQLYKENWIEWDGLARAMRIEAFQLLEDRLRKATLTTPHPGGVDYWPVDSPIHSGLCLLQDRDPATMQILPAPREGLDLLATQERAGRQTWLSTVPQKQDSRTQPILVEETANRGNSIFSEDSRKLPYWIEAGMELGVRFWRVAAAGYPPASTDFVPRSDHSRNGECACGGCCEDCGCDKCVHIDEYYFWLVDGRYFDPASQEERYDQDKQSATSWHEPKGNADKKQTDTYQSLFEMPSLPMVRLGWCRVHRGEFQVPNRSDEGIAISDGQIADLDFKGRTGDSLYFGVTKADENSGPNPGFRYDIAVDDAVVLEDAAPADAPTTGGIGAYPFFAYYCPGARLFPWWTFAPAIAIACALRMRCSFEAALKWYATAYDPLNSDNTWVNCQASTPDPSPNPDPTRPPEDRERNLVNGDDNPSDDNPIAIVNISDRTPQRNARSACCDSTDTTCNEARHRAILMAYIETLLQWVDAVMRTNSPESAQQARLILDVISNITGPRPSVIIASDTDGSQTVTSFVPLFAPLNPRLMSLYDSVDDKKSLIHLCENDRRLVSGRLGCEMPYWGNANGSVFLNSCEDREDHCCDVGEWCLLPSPYRFQVLVQKAQELAGRVRELGGALLAAFEKGDAEFLAAINARNEHELLVLGRKIRQDQWRDADWQVQALEKSKEVSQNNLKYYLDLIQNGLNSNEYQYVASVDSANASRDANISMIVTSEAFDVIPDTFVGFPCNFTELPVGTKMANMFRAIGQAVGIGGEITSSSGQRSLTESGWDRRLEEWGHQVTVLKLEIEQIEIQILGAERRRDQALRELNSQERQIQQSEETKKFLRDKFTNHALFLFLQKETSALYQRMYELAAHTSRQAVLAFKTERGHHVGDCLPCESWDNYHEGLLAGERLELCLARLEKQFLDENVREYEVTKHFSLRRDFPWQFLELKLTGRCEMDIPEWMYDQDYPGHFMRRIKTVSLTIPCVVGPYTGIHSRLTLLNSITRVDPTVPLPPSRCCSKCKCGNGYETCSHDPRLLRHYAAREAIVTSGGQSDAGLFEPRFTDERYLPFEYEGAVGNWRIEMPRENNYFNVAATLTDLIMQVNYTSREGGEKLRDAAFDMARRRLPGCGWILLDVRHDLPDAWARFCAPDKEGHRHRRLEPNFERNMFPYLPGCEEIAIDKIAMVFQTREENQDKCPEECPCPEEKRRAFYEIECTPLERDRECDCGCGGRCHDDDIDLNCVVIGDCPNTYSGVADIRLEDFDRDCDRRSVRFDFPECTPEVSSMFLLVHYTARQEECSKHGRTRLCCDGR